MSDYFTVPDDIVAGTRIRSSKINDIIQAIENGFDALPAALGDYVTEIENARDGEATLLDQINDLQLTGDEVEAARDGESSLLDQINDLQLTGDEVEAARDGEASLLDQINDLQLTGDEVEAARDGEANLDTRLDGFDDDIALLGDAELPGQTGNAGKYLTTDGINSSWGASLENDPTDGNFLVGDGSGFVTESGATVRASLGLADLIRDTRTSNTILAASDKGNLIDVTSNSFTQTLTAAATLGDGWYCYIRNSGTGVITVDPNSSETIDGVTTFRMYPGEMRLVYCTGALFITQVLHPFYYAFTSSGTFYKPPGYSYIGGLLVGGGGGGYSGDGYGGSGGGGLPFMFPAADLGTSETITIGSGGTQDNNGGDSSFGDHGTAEGGIAGNSSGGSASAGGGVAIESLSINNVNNIYKGGSSGYESAATGTNCSVYGGGGGAKNNGSQGYSIHAGDGSYDSTAGSIPGGGGGRSANGSRGECRVWGIV